LLAEHALMALELLDAMSPDELRARRLAFLRTRTMCDEAGENPRRIFPEEILASLDSHELDKVDRFDLAVWEAFHARPIICSTSSNMGISLHQALRRLQETTECLRGQSYPLLNRDEGWLVIWCPDERADFMNAEKTELLRALETEKPPLTALHTYINRTERDPGALKDALTTGGYFFPTNPQSVEEIQNLLYNSLNELARERKTSLENILTDENVCRAMAGLKCEIRKKQVVVRSGVVGGLYGLMLPYLLLLEETVKKQLPIGISTWNQASIGAGLAALVLADMQLRMFPQIPEPLKMELNRFFPRLFAFLQQSGLGVGLETRIHGVFDLANLQSLAQLLGVVVEKHFSGRKTALVGLGSSSYATGNRCYDILKRSVESEGPFRGKGAFHPATHTLIPLAQALIFADDLFRLIRRPEFRDLTAEKQIAAVRKHVRKCEPAGAASVAGFLLTGLDGGSLSLWEIAFPLRLMGFDRKRFLEFSGFGRDGDAANRYTQESSEEGKPMGALAARMLTLLDADLDELQAKAQTERRHSRFKARLSSLEDENQTMSFVTLLNLTGDNTGQPSKDLVGRILAEAWQRYPVLEKISDLVGRDIEKEEKRIFGLSLFNKALLGISRRLRRGSTHLENFRRYLIQVLIGIVIARSPESGHRK
jgi:hypothetical protein